MHDVNRDSLISKPKKGKNRLHQHDHDDHEHEDDDHDHHEHDHEDHEHIHGHNHEHEDTTYEEHDHDIHAHNHDGLHDHEISEDRAFTHLHEHGHNFFHGHHHTHHPEHVGIIHRIFGDPVRDWFGAFFMVLLILLGYYQVAPGPLSNGMLVCAAVVGIYPILKNALFAIITKRRFSSELVVGMVLLIGLLLGKFLEVAFISLLLLVGSFLRLNFSWRHE